MRRLRMRQALSQLDLAASAGISRGAVMRIEQGQPARPSTIRRLAHALGVGVMKLTVGE